MALLCACTHRIIGGGKKKKGSDVFQFPLFYLWFLLVSLVPEVFCCDAVYETKEFIERKNTEVANPLLGTPFFLVGVSNFISQENIGGVLFPFSK